MERGIDVNALSTEVGVSTEVIAWLATVYLQGLALVADPTADETAIRRASMAAYDRGKQRFPTLTREQYSDGLDALHREYVRLAGLDPSTS